MKAQKLIMNDLDSAIIFRENGNVEVLYPEMDVEKPVHSTAILATMCATLATDLDPVVAKIRVDLLARMKHIAETEDVTNTTNTLPT